MSDLLDRRDFLSLEEIHAEELRLLVWFDGFCEVHGLRYSLTGGTLLGAVRHKGFIPWDDDVDVCMPRPDYDKLLSMRDELPDGLTIIDSATSDFLRPFAKLFDTSIRAQEPDYEGVMDEYLWIDLFPMDGVPFDEDELDRLRRRVKLAVKNSDYAYVNRKFTDSPKNALRCTWGVFARLFGNPRKRLQEVAAEVAHCPGYESASEVAEVLSSTVTPCAIPRAGLENLIDIEFEGHNLKAMSCWDDYLTQTYGDYMELPSEEKRATHHVKAWRVSGEAADA